MLLRPAAASDVPAIAELHERYNARPADRSATEAAVSNYPSMLAFDTDGSLIGFAYCGRFAPDILELRNLLVIPSLRDAGVGARLLAALEGAVEPPWSSVILSNSTAYLAPGKRPATNFYLRAGYHLAWSTDTTSVFIKDLSPR